MIFQPAWLRSHAFTLGLIGIVALSWLAPQWGSEDGILLSSWTQPMAMALIFLVQGMCIPTEEFRRSLGRARLHALVQCWIFLAYPLAVLGMTSLPGTGLPPGIRQGFLFLSVLPTTISASVFFTESARGAVADSVFNSSLSSLLAVFLTPLGAALLIFSRAGAAMPLLPLLGKLGLLIVLPLLAGQVLRRLLAPQLPRLRPWFRPATTASIFFIMYCTFCQGWRNEAWKDLGWAGLVSTLLHALILLVAVSTAVWWVSGRLGFDRRSRIPILFCSSHKSLAAGVPLAGLVLPSQPVEGIPDASILLLPLILFHPLQLLLAAMLADRLSARLPGPESPGE